jgi:cardiolipin synthase
LEEDEKIVGEDAAGDRLAERYALVLVRNGKPEGLPKSATLLERAVIEAANKGILVPHSMGPVTVKASVAPRRINEGAPTPKQISFQSSDLILGGDAHKAAFVNVFKKARVRIVIHSTFVSRDSLEFAMPYILDAGRRGVRVDILWGEGEDKPEVTKTRELLAVARADLSAISLYNLVAIHPFSTNSHAKLIVSDDSQIGRDVAIVGSCNWLYSTLASLDASPRLREPTIVADVIDVLSDISRGGDRLWKPLSINLAELAREVRADV